MALICSCTTAKHGNAGRILRAEYGDVCTAARICGARTKTFATEQTAVGRASSVIAGLCAWRTIPTVRAMRREHKR